MHYTREYREAFYDAVCRAQKEAVQGLKGARARRLAERRVIFNTLVSFGLAGINRGGRPL